MAARNLHIFTKYSADHFKNGCIIFFDPQNIGLDTSFVMLQCMVAKIWTYIDFPIIAAPNLHILQNIHVII